MWWMDKIRMISCDIHTGAASEKKIRKNSIQRERTSDYLDYYSRFPDTRVY
jgi:hypothetical protein